MTVRIAPHTHIHHLNGIAAKFIFSFAFLFVYYFFFFSSIFIRWPIRLNCDNYQHTARAERCRHARTPRRTHTPISKSCSLAAASLCEQTILVHWQQEQAPRFLFICFVRILCIGSERARGGHSHDNSAGHCNDDVQFFFLCHREAMNCSPADNKLNAKRKHTSATKIMPIETETSSRTNRR